MTMQDRGIIALALSNTTVVEHLPQRQDTCCAQILKTLLQASRVFSVSTCEIDQVLFHLPICLSVDAPSYPLFC
jgi:hypothetical protein